MNGVGDEFLDEDVIVRGVADGTADDADGEGEGGDCGDEVVGANDGRHDGGGHHNTADSEAREDQETPELVQIVDSRVGEGAAAWEVFVSFRQSD